MKRDIFRENEITPVRGLLKRYKDRVLVELTLKCPVDCDFCYRKWKKKCGCDELSFSDIDRMVNFVSADKNIKEIIFSGGEPLLKLDLLEYGMKEFGKLKQIKIFRIHTRAPITATNLVSKRFLDLLEKKSDLIIYLSIHINKSDELNSKVEKTIKEIRKTGVILYSQSVFLKGINNSVDILEKLFLRLVELGVRPYNIYQCNKIDGIEKFIVPLKEEIKIMTELRRRLSGLACPNFILDIPGNANKIPVPTFFWDVDLEKVRDFDGNSINLSDI